MTKTVTFTLAIIFALTTWLAAERTHHSPVGINLVTSFDFAAYPACSKGEGTRCIQGIRFYDADSKQLLTEVPVDRNMTGRRQIVGKITPNSIPRAVYAVTVYADASKNTREGSPGEVSEFRKLRQ